MPHRPNVRECAAGPLSVAGSVRIHHQTRKPGTLSGSAFALTFVALIATIVHSPAHASCFAYGNYLRTIGQVDIPGAGYVVKVQDHYAYTAAYWGGLQVVDLHVPSQPQLVAVRPMDDACEDVAVRGDLLAAAVNGAGVQLYSIANRTQPFILSTWTGATAAYGVAFFDHYVLVADILDGLFVLDIVDPTQPSLVGQLPLSYPVRVTTEGNRVCVMDAYDGLLTIDMSDPLHPSLAGKIDIAHPGFALAIQDDLAYYTDYSAGLYIADVSDIANPIQLGFVALPQYNLQLAVSGNRVLVADGTLAASVVDCSDPTDPVLLGMKTFSTSTNGPAFDGDLAVFGIGNIRANDGKIVVVDLVNPRSPLLGHIDTNGRVWDLTLLDTYALLADGPAGMRVIDVADPANPHRVSLAGTTGDAMSVATDGKSAFVACYDGGLEAFDLSDPETPVFIGQVDTPGQAVALRVKDGLVYLADQLEGLAIIDVSHPAAPQLLSELRLADRVWDLAFDFPYAYVASATAGLCVVDVSDPAHPVQVAAVRHGYSVAYDVQLVGDIAYICFSDGLMALDISNPVHPVELGFGAGFNTAFRLAVHGNYAYTATDLAGLQVFNISNPAQPYRVGGDDTPHEAFGIASNDHHVFMTDDLGGLYVYPLQCELTEFTAGVNEAPGVRLSSAWPNPSAGAVSLAFETVASGVGSLAMYDAAGRRLRLVANTEFAAGPTLLSWDGLDDSGAQVPSGVYWARVTLNGNSDARRVVIRR